MGIGDWLSDVFGSKNKEKVNDTANPVNVNANAYQYGGQPGGADAAANRYQANGEQAQGRGAAQADFSGAQPDFRGAQPDYASTQRWEGASDQSRNQQGQAANLMMSRAMGQQPSIAGQQASQDIGMLQQNAQNQARAAQASQGAQAASARGAAGVALAGQTAANNTANAQSAIGHSAAQATQNISGQAQVNAAQERSQAEQAAFGAASGMRQGDTGMANDQAQRAQFNANLGTNQQQFKATLGSGQQQFNTQMQDTQRGRNDAMQLGMTQAEMGVRGQQLGASQNEQAQRSANSMGAIGINAGVGGQNASMNQSNVMGLMGAAAKVYGGAAGAAAEGGPVHGGRPYIVGERGPELIVPPKDGVVIPNHMLGHPDAHPQVFNVSPQVIDDAPDAADTVLSTWGNKPGMTTDEADESIARRSDRASAQNQERAARAVSREERLNTTTAAPGSKFATVTSPVDSQNARDRDTMARAGAYEAQGAEQSGRDKYEAQGAEYRLDNDRKAKGATSKAKPAPATLSSAIGSLGSDISQGAGRIDTAYHGPSGGFVPPQLIQVSGARASGGPVAGGQPYLVGEQGPELIAPGVGGAGLAMAPKVNVPTTAAPAEFGGMPGRETAGDDYLHNAYDKSRTVQAPGANMGGKDAWTSVADKVQADAREEGGPVEAGQPYVVGEKGPEVIVSPSPHSLPLPKPPPVDNRYSIENAPRAPSPEGAVSFYAERPRIDAADMVLGDYEEPSRGPTGALAQAMLGAADDRRVAELKKAGHEVTIVQDDAPQRRMMSFTRDTPSDQARMVRDQARPKKPDPSVAVASLASRMRKK